MPRHQIIRPANSPEIEVHSLRADGVFEDDDADRAWRARLHEQDRHYDGEALYRRPRFHVNADGEHVQTVNERRPKTPRKPPTSAQIWNTFHRERSIRIGEIMLDDTLKSMEKLVLIALTTSLRPRELERARNRLPHGRTRIDSVCLGQAEIGRRAGIKCPKAVRRAIDGLREKDRIHFQGVSGLTTYEITLGDFSDYYGTSEYDLYIGPERMPDQWRSELEIKRFRDHVVQQSMIKTRNAKHSIRRRKISKSEP